MPINRIPVQPPLEFIFRSYKHKVYNIKSVLVLIIRRILVRCLFSLSAYFSIKYTMTISHKYTSTTKSLNQLGKCPAGNSTQHPHFGICVCGQCCAQVGQKLSVGEVD